MKFHFFSFQTINFLQDDDEDDDEDDEEESKPPSKLKTPSKQKPSTTPTKSETKPKQETATKQSTPAADKPLNKIQLFINSIKESVSVSDMKALYPKAKIVKMQKRKVGPNHKVIQYVSIFLSFLFFLNNFFF
jgi:FtsZ-interacting cell division protein YlmF